MSDPNPAKSRRVALLVRFSYVLSRISMGLPVAVVVGLATGGARRALIFGVSYACLVTLIWQPELWLGALVGWRGSEKLWRERMASGFYKTLPPWKDDEDD
ncbi:MAG: hypothetical protein ABSC51_11665 [Gaiellaceae bacterium]|jgi:hypothetical protein